MIRERLARLIEAEIDGENTPEESRELRLAIESDPEAAHSMSEARAVADILDGIAAVDPPPGLRQALREVIRRRDQLSGSRQVVPSRSPIERKGVSTMQNRKWIVAAAAVFVAAIAVGYVALRPGPSPEDAAGTVGAVKKHRAPQITQQDVVLGSETAPSWAPYADFYNDAAMLGNAAAKLEAATKLLESRTELGNREALEALNTTVKLLGNQADDLTGRMDKIKVIQPALGSSVDLSAINVKLAGVVTELQSASDLSGTNAHRISSALNDIRTQLGSAAAQDLSGRISADRIQMLGSLDLQANAVQAAKIGLTPIVGSLEASSSLDAIQVNALKPKIQELANRLLEQKTQLEHKALTGLEGQLKIATLQSKEIEAMRDNVKLATTTLDARVAVAGGAGARDLQATLGSLSQALESSSLDTNRTVGQLVNAQIGGIDRVLGSRQLTLGAQDLEGLNQHVKALDTTLRGTVLGAKDLEAAAGKLDQVKLSLESRSQGD